MNLITSSHATGLLLAVEKELVWVQVPIAVDSGACVHVTPPGLFSIGLETPTVLPTYYGADGAAIKCLGSMTVASENDNQHQLSFRFDVMDKLSKPLLSVMEMTSKGHKVEFANNGAWITTKNGNAIELRADGRLWMLDLWCQVPAEVARNTPFVRQTAP